MVLTDTTTSPAYECGAGCGRSFPTLDEVFSHPCDSVPRWAADRMGGAFPVATNRGDSVDTPERRESTGRRSEAKGPGAPRTNRYAADCARCGLRVDAGEGLLVRDHTGGSGGAAKW